MIQATGVAAPVVGWGTAIMTSLTAALMMFFAAIPRIIGFIVIIAVGWVVARWLGKLVGALLRAVRLDAVAERTGIADFLRSAGSRQTLTGIAATATRWFVRLIVVLVAFDSLGITGVSGVLEQMLLWLPNLVVALVILALGGLAAKALADITRGTAVRAGFGSPTTIANVVRGTVLAFTVVIALNQLNVAEVVVNTLLIATIGAIALALGLAFGLGGREMAAQAIENWKQRAQESRPQFRAAAAAAREEAAERREEATRFWQDQGIPDRRRSGADRRQRMAG